MIQMGMRLGKNDERVDQIKANLSGRDAELFMVGAGMVSENKMAA